MNKQESSTLVMALAIIAATMLVSTVIVGALDLIDDAEARKIKIKNANGPLTQAIIQLVLNSNDAGKTGELCCSYYPSQFIPYFI